MEQDFNSIFSIGIPNEKISEYFSGKSYLSPLCTEEEWMEAGSNGGKCGSGRDKAVGGGSNGIGQCAGSHKNVRRIRRFKSRILQTYLIGSAASGG